MPKPTVGTGRVARKRQQRINKIRDAAAKLFASKGYHATSMEDIAAALDLQKGSLYYYFSSKEALLCELIEQQIDAAVDILHEIHAAAEQPTDKFRRAVEAHLKLFNQHADIQSIFLFENLGTINRELAQSVEDLARRYRDAWRHLFEAGVAAGEFRSDLDVSLTIMAFEGMMNFTVMWFRKDGRLTIEEASERFIELMLNGVLAEGKSVAEKI